MNARAKLEVDGLQKRFGGLTAVRDVSFSVHAGEILGLIGPNGSGKSTVMKSILGVERPDAGSVWIDGREVAGWPPHRIARLGVGMVFQHSRPLHRQTVLENILLGLLPDRLLDLLPGAATEAGSSAGAYGFLTEPTPACTSRSPCCRIPHRAVRGETSCPVGGRNGRRPAACDRQGIRTGRMLALFLFWKATSASASGWVSTIGRTPFNAAKFSVSSLSAATPLYHPEMFSRGNARS